MLQYRSTVTTDRPPFGWEYKWTCRVAGQEKVSTASGMFNTFVIRCGHEDPDLLTFYYAPKVGNYVIRRTRQPDGKPDLVRNLLVFERADGSVIVGDAPQEGGATAAPQTSRAAAPVMTNWRCGRPGSTC